MAKPNFISARAEFIGDVPFAVNSVQQLPTQSGQLPPERFMFGLMCQFEGRINYGATAPTGVQADGAQAIIENISLTGTYRPNGEKRNFINMRGTDLFVLSQLYHSYTPLNLPTPPLATGVTHNDIKFNFLIPFVPPMLPLGLQFPYLLDVPNYDGITLNVQWGDDFSIFTGQTAGAAVWSAFGGSTGTPRLRVTGQFAMSPGRFRGFVPARTWLYFQENASSVLTSTANQQRLQNIPRGYRMRAMLLKTGVKSTAVTAGNNAYNSLSNSILANINVMQGTNKPIRVYNDFQHIQQEVAAAYGHSFSPPTGYALVDFAQHGVDSELLDLAGLIAGPDGDTDTFVRGDVTGASNQALLSAFMEIRGQAAQARR